MHDCSHVTYFDHTRIMTISITIRMAMTTIMMTTNTSNICGIGKRGLKPEENEV